MRILLLVGLLTGQSAPCDETAQREAVTVAGRDVRNCIRAEAPALAGSRDRADDVATAIMVRCQSRFENVIAVVATCSPSSAGRLRARLGRDFHAVAVEEVVSLRARR